MSESTPFTSDFQGEGRVVPLRKTMRAFEDTLYGAMSETLDVHAQKGLPLCFESTDKVEPSGPFAVSRGIRTAEDSGHTPIVVGGKGKLQRSATTPGYIYTASGSAVLALTTPDILPLEDVWPLIGGTYLDLLPQKEVYVSGGLIQTRAAEVYMNDYGPVMLDETNRTYIDIKYSVTGCDATFSWEVGTEAKPLWETDGETTNIYIPIGVVDGTTGKIITNSTGHKNLLAYAGRTISPTKKDSPVFLENAFFKRAPATSVDDSKSGFVYIANDVYGGAPPKQKLVPFVPLGKTLMWDSGAKQLSIDAGAIGNAGQGLKQEGNAIHVDTGFGLRLIDRGGSSEAEPINDTYVGLTGTLLEGSPVYILGMSSEGQIGWVATEPFRCPEDPEEDPPETPAIPPDAEPPYPLEEVPMEGVVDGSEDCDEEVGDSGTSPNGTLTYPEAEPLDEEIDTVATRLLTIWIKSSPGNNGDNSGYICLSPDEIALLSNWTLWGAKFFPLAWITIISKLATDNTTQFWDILDIQWINRGWVITDDTYEARKPFQISVT
jgi:hypothetical protein